MSQDPYDKARDTLTELQSISPPYLAADGQVMTVRIEYPPGGPCFGYILEGEMVFEVQGEPPRVVKEGEAFWEPGGDVIHC